MEISDKKLPFRNILINKQGEEFGLIIFQNQQIQKKFHLIQTTEILFKTHTLFV